jgi:endonuclease/exonuclease/phosphatase (EEP) superfamily protein YafD
MIFLGIFSFYFDLGVRAAEQDTKSLKVLSANIWYKNEETEKMRTFLEDQDADILMLTEFTNNHYIALQDYFESNYEYQSLRLDELSFPYTGKVVFSRYPLKTEKDDGHKFDELFLKNEVEVNDKKLKLVMVHTTAPVNVDYYNNRNAQLSFINSNIITSPTHNTLLTGDFNLSPWSPRFYEINKHLEDLSMERVQTNEFDYTWKYQGNGFFKSHIDHTYTSKGIRTTSYEYKEFPGSDHKAQVFTLVFE